MNRRWSRCQQALVVLVISLIPLTALAPEGESDPPRQDFDIVGDEMFFPAPGYSEKFNEDPLIKPDASAPFPGLVVPSGTFRRDDFDFILAGGKKFTDPPPDTPAGSINNEGVDLAVRSAMSGDPAGLNEAYEKFRAADRTDPLFFAFVYNAGRCAYLLGRYREATDYFRRTVGLIPGCSACYLNLGRSLLKNKDQIGGRSALKRAAEINPFDPDPLTELGVDRLEGNDIHRATIYFREALRIDPTSPDATLGMARIRIQKGDLENARALLDDMEVRIDTPESNAYRKASALFYRGIILEKTGLYGLAADRYESILEIASTTFFLDHPADEIRRMIKRARRLQELNGIYDNSI